MTILDAAILLAFVGFGAGCWYLRISYRLSVVAGLVLLFVAAVITAVGQEVAGNFIAILAYYALVTGVALAIVEWRKGEREARVAVVSSETPRSEKAGRPKSSAIRFRRLRALWKRLHP
jgi:hypothetical protein